MTDSVIRFLMLLNASGCSQTEFRNLLQELRESDPRILMSEFLNVKDALREVSNAGLSRSREVSELDQIQSDIQKFVESNGASGQIAAKRLRSRLSLVYPEEKIPQVSSKQGFSRWLSRVLTVVPATAVLNAAISEFSKQSGPPGDDWKLSR